MGGVDPESMLEPFLLKRPCRAQNWGQDQDCSVQPIGVSVWWIGYGAYICLAVTLTCNLFAPLQVSMAGVFQNVVFFPVNFFQCILSNERCASCTVSRYCCGMLQWAIITVELWARQFIDGDWIGVRV